MLVLCERDQPMALIRVWNLTRLASWQLHSNVALMHVRSATSTGTGTTLDSSTSGVGRRIRNNSTGATGVPEHETGMTSPFDIHEPDQRPHSMAWTATDNGMGYHIDAISNPEWKFIEMVKSGAAEGRKHVKSSKLTGNTSIGGL